MVFMPPPPMMMQDPGFALGTVIGFILLGVYLLIKAIYDGLKRKE